MSATQQLEKLGIALPPTATPAGSYVPAIRVGDLIYTSGQLPMVDGKLMATGIVGRDGLTTATAADCARTCALNALAAAAQVAGGLDNIKQVVKLTVFVASSGDPEYTEQAAVANGASDLLLQIFGDAGRHVRSAVGMASLPLQTPVEVEMIVEVQS